MIFLVAGEQKAAIVKKFFAITHSNEEFPATLVHPDSGSLTWMLDSKAASRISSEFGKAVS